VTIGGVPADFDGRCPECGIDVPAENLGLHYTVMHKGLGRIATPVRARRPTVA
jgi:hypothetical protein